MNQKMMKQLPLYIMLLPGMLLVFIFHYIPMGGIIIAFQKYIPAKGLFGDQQWVGLGNFKYVQDIPGIWGVLWNTLYISSFKIILSLLVPIIFSVLINEVMNTTVKRSIQTMIYLPHFMSWVILGGVLIDILSPSKGIMNQLLGYLGIEPIFFMGDNKWFPFTLIISDIWKEFGFGTIVFLSAITGIDPQLYDSAMVDGANRWDRIRHITLPGMVMVIVLISVLKLGSVLNAGFDQVFNMYSPAVYESGDILDTLVYRVGLQQSQFGVAAAVGLFKSVVSTILVSLSYILAYKLADYRIF